VKLMPSDQLASQLLSMVSTPAGGTTPTPGAAGAVASNPADPNRPAPSQPIQGQPTEPQMNPNLQPIDPAAIVGHWRATRDDGSSFDVTLSADKNFDWKFAQQQQGQPARNDEFAGTYGVE